MYRIYFIVAFLALVGRALPDEGFPVRLRYQVPTEDGSQNFHRLHREERWAAEKTAVIVCDMWDSHHCVNAVRRVLQVTPRVNGFCSELRERGATIVHAPSGCMSFYEHHRARIRAMKVPVSKVLPDDIASWCDRIPSEEAAAYPLDQSAGGEDDDPVEHQQWADRLAAIGRDPGVPWQKQVEGIRIDEKRDYISDSGPEIWSILEEGDIQNVILVGVHTNMCVLGRPFGLRRLASAGKNVVLARDLTDTMYDPRAWPFASHFTGTELIVDHIERYVCPTMTSQQILSGHEFRFSGDRRQRLLMLIAEDEYQTETTLPKFAAKHLSQHFSVSIAFGSEAKRHQIIGMNEIGDADALLVSVRRRALPAQDMQRIRDFVASGKPVIGIRTASHAFSLRGEQPPADHAVWEDFDPEVFGGNYRGHYANSLQASLSRPAGIPSHPILTAVGEREFSPAGSLYQTAPLESGALPLLLGRVSDEALQPVAWTFVRSDGGRSFYTSLGHPEDFEQPTFEALLSAGIHWACGLPIHPLAEIEEQNTRYASGAGKQR